MSLADWENIFIIWNRLYAECTPYHWLLVSCNTSFQSALYNVFGIYTLCTVFTAESEAQSGKYSVQLTLLYMTSVHNIFVWPICLVYTPFLFLQCE